MTTLAAVSGRGVNASRPAASIAGAYYLSTDIGPGILYRDNGSSWDAIAFANSLTTQDDTFVADASGYPTRLAKGNAGAAHSILNGHVAWNSGTSFPSAVTGDRYWRTDQSAEYYYDGTRWLTSSIVIIPLGPNESAFPLAADGLVGRGSVWGATDMWIVQMQSSSYVATTNDGSHFWTITLNKNNAAGAATSVASYTTSGDTVNNYTTHTTSVGALLGSFKSFQVNAARTSTPGSLYWSGFLHVRIVGT